MEQYYFLFTLALIWTLFAVIQDFKTREVANWLNFSLITLALAYRAFYSASTNNYDFLILGFLGFVIFFILAYLFYYMKAFAGGDAKLLMGYGAILPYQNYNSLLTTTLLFIFLLFLVGALYSIIYSFFIVGKNKNKFTTIFAKNWKKAPSVYDLSAIILLFIIIYSFFNPKVLLFLIIPLTPLIYIYAISLDKCMVKLYPPEKLTEGDWLEQNIRINSELTIKKSVHGLSLKEIQLLRKHKKKVLIKEGIPFTPTFLIALIIMVYAFSTLELPQFFSFF